jgi:lipoprotein-anchoring transpeptidase ErfK/SrfK
MTRWAGAAAVLVASALVGCAAGRVAHRAISSEGDAAPGSARARTQPAQRAAVEPTTKTTPKPTPPKPKPNACARNTAPQLVLVSLAKQRVWMCARSRTVYSSAVTTGMVGQDTSTPTGTYQIQARSTDTTLTLNTGATYAVKYWIPFDAPLFGFHDSSWQSFPYGSARYRTEGSHGCIHMPLAAMKFLYGWGQIGATVTIRA